MANRRRKEEQKSKEEKKEPETPKDEQRNKISRAGSEEAGVAEPTQLTSIII